jgi:hypothetical protein
MAKLSVKAIFNNKLFLNVWKELANEKDEGMYSNDWSILRMLGVIAAISCLLTSAVIHFPPFGGNSQHIIQVCGAIG